MKTKVGERKRSARPPAHDHDGTHTKRVLPEAHSFGRLDRDCSAGQDSPRLSDVKAGQPTAAPGAGVPGQRQQEGQWKQKRLQAEQKTPTPPSAGPQQSCEALSARRELSRPPATRVHQGTWDYLRATCPGSEPLFPPQLPISADAETPTSPAGAGTCCGAPGAHLCGRCGGVGHPGLHRPCTRRCRGGGPARVRSQSRLGPSSRSSCGAAGTCNPGGPSCVGPAAALPPPRRGASHSRSASCRTEGRSGMARVPVLPWGQGLTHPDTHREACACPRTSAGTGQALPSLETGRSGQRGVPVRSVLTRVTGTCYNKTQTFSSPSSSYFPSLRACVSPLPLGLSKAGGEEAEPSGEHTGDKARLPGNRQGFHGHLGFPDPQEHWQNPCDPH